MLGHQQRCMRCMVDRMAYGLSVCQLQVIKRQPVLHLEFAYRGIRQLERLEKRTTVPGFYEHSMMLGGMIRHLHGRYAAFVWWVLHLHKTIQDRSTNYHLDCRDVHKASDYHSTRSTWASGCLFSQIKISSWLIKAKADKLQMCGLHNGFIMIMIHVQDPKNNGESPITIILVHPSKSTSTSKCNDYNDLRLPP